MKIKNILQSKVPLLTIFLGALVLLLLFTSGDSSEKSEKKTQSDTTNVGEVSMAYSPVDLSSAEALNCVFGQTIGAAAQNGSIQHYLPKPETNDIVVQFDDFRTDGTNNVAKMSVIDATQVMDSYDVIVSSSTNKIELFDFSDLYSMKYTVFLDDGVGTYEKTIDFLGTKVLTAGMGTCTAI